MPESGKLLEKIINDVTSGSTAIARKVTGFYSVSGETGPEFIKKAHESISKAHTGMGLVRNVNEMLYAEWMRDRKGIAEASRNLESEIDRQISASLSFASGLIADGVNVATISRSSAVSNLLRENRRKLGTVYVLESRPLREGISLAGELSNEGIDVTVTADASLQYVSGNADMALCGSDSVLGDMSLIHKIGTYPLFMSFRKAGKKTVSLTMDLKFERDFDSNTYPPFTQHESGEICSGNNFRVYNAYYDVTPPSYVSHYVSNSGTMAVSRQ